MKTLIALATTAALTTGALATTFPMYADMNRDGIVTATEYEAYAFRRADTDDSRYIEPGEQHRFDLLMDLRQEF